MCIKARDGMVQSLARRGEAERRFEEDDQLEDEDYEVRVFVCICGGFRTHTYIYMLFVDIDK